MAIASLSALGLSVWLLARALTHFRPATSLAAGWSLSQGPANWVTFGAAVAGVGLVLAAAGLSVGRAWAWLLAAACTCAAWIVLGMVWFYGGEVDWLGMALALATLMILAAPGVRTTYMGDALADE